MVRFIKTVGLSLVCALVAGHCQAATITDLSKSLYSQERIAILRLQGEIMAGDAGRVRAAIARLGPVDRIAIELDSPGGNYAEGLELARLFWKEQIATVVRNNKLCLSSCAIAFLGGARGRSGQARMMRLLEPQAKLGFHAPYLALPQSNAHSNEEIAAAFRVSINVMNELVDLAEHLHIHPRLLPQLMRPSSTEVFLIKTAEEIALYGFELLLTGDSVEKSIVDDPVGSLRRYTITKSMAVNLCSNAFAWRANFSLSSARKVDSGLTLQYFDEIGAEFGTYPILSVVDPKDSGRGMHHIGLSLPIGSARGFSGHNFCNLEIWAADPRRLRATEVVCRSFQSRSDFDAVEQRLSKGDLDGEQSESCYIGYRYGSLMAQRYAEQSEGRRMGPWWLVPADTQMTEVEAVLSNYQKLEPFLDPVALAEPICKRATKKTYYC